MRAGEGGGRISLWSNRGQQQGGRSCQRLVEERERETEREGFWKTL